MTETPTTDATSTDPLSLSPERIDVLYRRHLHATKLDEQRSKGLDVVLGRREGCQFEDLRTGRWFWNCHSNGGTFNFGHRNPRVIAAVERALANVDVGNHHLPSPYRALAAERLAATTGNRLPGVALCASGSEAIELAIKVARNLTGRRKTVTLVDSWHGTTGLALAANGGLLPQFFLVDEPDQFVQVPWNDADASTAAIDDQTGLVLMEAIPATSGFPLPEPGYLTTVARACSDAGALLAFDEVQTGLGRTGTVWSYEQDGVEPDLLVTGKGLSGGVYPVAALLMAPPVFEKFSETPYAHVSTFGGAEPGCAAAMAVCELLAEPGFLDGVRARAEQFREGFAGAPFGVRQRGLVMGLVVDDPDGNWGAWRTLLDRGVFTYPASFTTDVVQCKPPLIVTEDEAAQIIAAVRAALG